MGRRKTNKEFLKEVYDLVGNEYTFLEEYKSNKKPILIRHNKCGYEFKVIPVNFISSGTRCKKCSGLLKLSNEEFIDRVNEISNNEYIFLEEYRNIDTKILCRHIKCGHEYMVSPYYFLKGRKCPKCAVFTRRDKNIKNNVEFIKEVKKIVKDEYTFLEEYETNKVKLLVVHNSCNNKYYVRPNNFLRGARCPKCSNHGTSNSEKSVLKFIKKVYSGKIIENDRKILNGKEIDIYLPELKIGIEYCGLYWHSEIYVNKNYHLDKLKLSESKKVRLIQIFEDEWINKKSIVKSKIKHILGLNQDLPKIYARKCYIKEIDSKKKNKFLNKYHIQGNDISKIKLGLFTKINNVRKLVAVMTFSLPRRCLGNRDNGFNTYELSRFATKRKFNIIGGFSKLLSYFKKNYKFEEIITYADLRYSSFNGNLYEVNGFKLSHQSKPNYWYFYQYNTSIKHHRFNFRKGNLNKLFPKIYKDELTEHEITLRARYLRIYDCGTLIYKLKKE